MVKDSSVEIKKFINSIFSTKNESKNNFERGINELIESLDSTDIITSQRSMDELKFNSLVNRTCIPDFPIESYEYFNKYIKEIVLHSVNTASPNYIGHMTSALPNFIKPLSKLLVALNQNVVKTESSKVFTLQERSTIAMLHRLVYKQSEKFYNMYCQNIQSTLGIATSGGTIANMTALWIARNKAFDRMGLDIVKDGIAYGMSKSGYRRGVVIASSLVHYSIEKSMDALGIGSNNLIKVNVNEKGHMCIKELQNIIKECKDNGDIIFSLIGIGGATETGSVDPLEDIGYIAKENKVHFHVDAAWGGPILMSEKYSHVLKGIELADTVTIDGHKQLYMPMGLGIMLCKDPFIAKCIEKQSPYIIRNNSYDLGRRSLEGSRPALTFLLNALLTVISKKGYAFLIDEGIRKTRYMAEIINKSECFEVIGECQINILNYRYIPSFYREEMRQGKLSKEKLNMINLFNEKIQEKQKKMGICFVSRTKLTCYKKYESPITVLRAIIANPLTTEENIDHVINNQLEIAQEIEKEAIFHKNGGDQ